jgi:hypothetical protein
MYISPSNIVETGYTQGHQFVLPSGDSYKGFYHKDTKNRYWTGKEHTNSSIQLTNLTGGETTNFDLNYLSKNTPISKTFTEIYNQNTDTPLLKNDIIRPSLEDFNKGYFTRYVAQLKSSLQPENNIVELNQTTFNNTVQNSNIIKSYRFASFDWRLTGPLHDRYYNNIRVESGIIDTNLRSLQDVEKKAIPNITLFITDPLQFAF